MTVEHGVGSDVWQVSATIALHKHHWYSFMAHPHNPPVTCVIFLDKVQTPVLTRSVCLYKDAAEHIIGQNRSPNT